MSLILSLLAPFQACYGAGLWKQSSGILITEMTPHHPHIVY